MEPMYVDNVSSAMNALWAAWREEKAKNDEHYKPGLIYKEGGEEDTFKLASSISAYSAAVMFATFTGAEPRYLHIWVDKKGRLIPTFPADATREELEKYLRIATNLIAMVPISQQEEKESRG